VDESCRAVSIRFNSCISAIVNDKEAN